MTAHAYLRTDDDRDELEQLLVEIDTVRTADDIVAQLQIEYALDWLSDRGVDVVWSDMNAVARVGAVLRHRLGDGTLLLVLAPDLEARVLVLLLEQVVQVLERPAANAVWCVVPMGAPVEAGAFCVFDLPDVCVRW
jgi:hypothetical protein